MKRILRSLFASLLLIAAAPSAYAQATLSFKDIRGREITLKKLPQKISIDDGRYLVALSLIHPDPVSVIAAWPRDINRVGPDTYSQFQTKFPAIGTIKQIPSSAADFNTEAVMAAAPDVAVVSLDSGPTDTQVAQLTSAGITVVFIDFFTKPFQNQAESLRILGKLTGVEAKAEELINFRAAHVKAITDRVAKLAPNLRPTVFLEAHAGISADCCNAPGRGNMGDYIDLVGGANIGADVIKGATGKLNLEYVISRDPAVYIATGGPHLEKAGGLVLGAGYTEERARNALAKMAARPGLANLTAVKSGRTYGLSHQLINSPVDILAIEAFAKWIHPELFSDVDPERTLQDINTRFAAVPYTGVFWISLNK